MTTPTESQEAPDDNEKGGLSKKRQRRVERRFSLLNLSGSQDLLQRSLIRKSKNESRNE